MTKFIVVERADNNYSIFWYARNRYFFNSKLNHLNKDQKDSVLEKFKKLFIIQEIINCKEY